MASEQELQQQVDDLKDQAKQLLANGNGGNGTGLKGSKVVTYLYWTNFTFKMTEANQLLGDSNWEMWKTSFWVALMGAGYVAGAETNLTSIDEAKVATAIINNIKDGPMAIVASINKGTEMYAALKGAYGIRGIEQQVDLWTQL